MNSFRGRCVQLVKKAVVLHPFLFALFPVLAIYAFNMGELSLAEIIVPVVIAICSALALFSLFFFMVHRDGRKAGIVVSVSVLLFYSYGGVERLLESRVPWDPSALLLPLWALLLASCVVLMAKVRWTMRRLTIILNAAAAVMVIVPAVRIGAGQVKALHSVSGHEAAPADLQLAKPDDPPDIYYIILDAYAGSDHLLDAYGYDNRAFMDYLRDSGFYVASTSRSNYSRTWLSLPSSLNMDYISTLIPNDASDSQTWYPLSELVINSRVATLLQSAGYQYVSFNSCEELTWRSPNADVSIDASGSPLSPFERALVEYSLAGVVWDDTVNHREHVLTSFDELAEVPSIEGPKFVFAHIMCPHAPYVFDGDGGPVDVIDRQDGQNMSGLYLDQITFLNQKIEQVVDRILASSATPPIIILQGDHGPRFTKSDDRSDPTAEAARDAHMILNALYLPHGGSDLMYESISPVNTFRVIFNCYFGAELPLLADESYQSVTDNLFPLVNVTGSLEKR